MNTQNNEKLSVIDVLVYHRYNNCYQIIVNHFTLIRDHYGTQVRTFANGLILGIYGSIRNNIHISRTPQWLLFAGPDLRPITIQSKYSIGLRPYIKDIKEFKHGLDLTINDSLGYDYTERLAIPNNLNARFDIKHFDKVR